MILLESPHITIDGATLVANGGGGGGASGAASPAQPGDDGGDPVLTQFDTPAMGGSSNANGGRGGDGFAVDWRIAALR